MSNENNSIVSFLPNFNLDECKKLINANIARGCGLFEYEQPINITQLKIIYNTFPNILFFIKDDNESITHLTWMTSKYLKFKSK